MLVQHAASEAWSDRAEQEHYHTMALQYFAHLWALPVGLSRLEARIAQATRSVRVLSVWMGQQQQAGESESVQSDSDGQLARVAGARVSLYRVAQLRASRAPHAGQLAGQHATPSFRAL